MEQAVRESAVKLQPHHHLAVPEMKRIVLRALFPIRCIGCINECLVIVLIKNG